MTDNFETFEYVIDAHSAGKRLDVVLASLPQLESRSQASRLIEQGLVLDDDEMRNKSYLTKPGETLTVTIPPPRQSSLEPESIDLDIRFEDEEIIVLSKPAGMVVHPAPGHWSGTLVNALLGHCQKLGTMQTTLRPGIVHRLDKGTSGLMVAAKSDRALTRLQDAIKNRQVDRRYLVLVHGRIKPDSGTIEAALARMPANRLKMGISDSPQARDGVTTFEVLRRFEPGRYDDGFSLAQCKLHTGRTHQIRVHMRYIGHPVAGDPDYGKGSLAANHYLTRQFLHSYKLGFKHPSTGEVLSFTDDLPPDLQTILDGLESTLCQ